MSAQEHCFFKGLQRGGDPGKAWLSITNVIVMWSWLTISLTAICHIKITSWGSWNCHFRGHLIITPYLGGDTRVVFVSTQEKGFKRIKRNETLGNAFVTDRQTDRQILWHHIQVCVNFFFKLNLLPPYSLSLQRNKQTYHYIGDSQLLLWGQQMLPDHSSCASPKI